MHRVLKAIGTRYVGKNPRNRKVDAALYNFKALLHAGTPQEFFKRVAAEKGTEARARYLSENLQYYKKKGCRDILIEFQLARDCVALDQRIRNILEGIGAKIYGSIDQQYEQIERELLERVAKPNGLSGGELDRILFRNYADLMVR